MFSRYPPIERRKIIGKVSGTDLKEARRLLIIEGSLYRALGILVWPFIVQVILQMMTGFVDTYMISYYGRINASGPDHLAAIGLSRNAIMLIFSFAIGIGIGVSTLVAQYTGKGDHKRAVTVGVDAFWFLALLSALVFIFGHLYVDDFISIYKSTEPVNALMAQYLIVFIDGMFVFLLSFIVFNLMQGTGDTFTPMVILAIMNVVNVLLNWILIFGPAIPLLGVEAWDGMGIKGAAIGTIASRGLGCAIAMWLLFSGRYRIDMRKAERFLPSWFGILPVLRIGLPTAFQMVSRNISVLVLNIIVSYSIIHEKAHAALNTGFLIEWLPFGPAMALMHASAIIIGQNIGAGRKDRVEKAVNIAFGFALCIMTLVAIVFLLWAEQLAGIFSDDRDVITSLASYLRIIGISDIFLAAIIYAGAIRAAGDAISPMIINVSSIWVLRIPLAFILLKVPSLDYNGVWLAMAISQVIQGIALVVLFKTGRWKKIDLVGAEGGKK